jgi:TPR repeat protein
MNFFRRTLLFITITLSVFAAGALLQEALRMYQDDTLIEHPKAIAALKDYAKDNADAAFLLATSYKDGKLGEINLKEAYNWYIKAAKMGDADAMLMLGWLHYSGKVFGSSNLKKAKEWFSKAADKGVDEAIEMLEILNS